MYLVRPPLLHSHLLASSRWLYERAFARLSRCYLCQHMACFQCLCTRPFQVTPEKGETSTRASTFPSSPPLSLSLLSDIFMRTEKSPREELSPQSSQKRQAFQPQNIFDRTIWCFVRSGWEEAEQKWENWNKNQTKREEKKTFNSSLEQFQWTLKKSIHLSLIDLTLLSVCAPSINSK